MCKFKFRFLIALLTFGIGVLAVWLGICFFSLSKQTDSLKTGNTNSVDKGFKKPEIRFKQFKTVKDTTFAEFELVNNTTEAISYNADKRDTYCSLAFDDGQTASSKTLCYCGAGALLYRLDSGETASYLVTDIQTRNFFDLNNEKIISGRFGFKVFVGADEREEILWSENITFSN